MIHIADLAKVVALTLASAYVKGEKPASLMIVSDRPESGKTELVKKFSELTGVAVLSDVTAYALWRDFHKQILNGEIRHFIIPEFLAPISRSASVASFIATMQMMIEEGLSEIHTGFLEPIILPTPVTIGLIICMPRSCYGVHKMEWDISGFLSRFIVATYKYDDETIDAIFQSIVERQYLQEGKLNLHFTEATIEIPLAIALKCRKLAETITDKARKDGRLYGFRELKNILRFVASNVIVDRANGSDRTVANDADFDEIYRISYLFNEQFNALGDKEVEIGEVEIGTAILTKEDN